MRFDNFVIGVKVNDISRFVQVLNKSKRDKIESNREKTLITEYGSIRYLIFARTSALSTLVDYL